MVVLGKAEADVTCSFCGKTESDDVKIIAGPTVNICQECVFLCVNILSTQFGVVRDVEVCKQCNAVLNLLPEGTAEVKEVVATK